ncbi:proton-conducting transporter membrane subunit [Dehalogenimonas alkenigignens]|uniref:Formate hydrogenlyase subunit 3/Multisubunit Na+/H+ antiporter, MnhD subunit n=1 Tax=Dehalogenimonas alkenigignens TaxID=1217799 RepID=A0A0W0GHI5_9CHLR|nr:proton-conducting transporter membrane subunit [Dehalogenimonas alkenigignens]KTB48012.1 Formate hydrogenlyase subunit 3/Multisubunit Na+/H+ antiporter, MnhD subunit [Dehalogenimonas alkenigignens]PVV84271.1 hydrogenase membrane subunit [Dehalogenimonas alkenigignens]
MDSLIIFGYAIPAVIAAAAAFLIGRFQPGGDGRRLNSLIIGEAVIYLGLSIWLAASGLPRFFTDNGYLMADTLGAYEAVITSVLFLLASVYARGYVGSLLERGEIERSLLGLFYGAFALLPLVIVMGFLSNNLALLWIFAELSTLFSVVLVVTLKARENITAALKYVFVTSTAMLFAFVGIIILFALSREVVPGGTLNWTDLMDAAASIEPRMYTFAFVFLFIGFGAKAAIAPFHTWLPTVYVRAPSVVAVVSGAVLNLGLYAILRLLALGHQAGDEAFLNPFLVAFGTASLFLAALALISRTNTKKLIAFSGIEHSGLILLAFGLGSPAALFWALFHKAGNALVKALLFFSAGIFHRQYGSNKFFAIKDPFRLQPLAAWGLVIGSAAAIGAPLTPVFLAKFNILVAAATQALPLFIAVLAAFLLAAAGFGYYLIRAFTQGGDAGMERYDTPAAMRLPIAAALVLLVALGVWLPGWLGDALNVIIADLGFQG